MWRLRQCEILNKALQVGHRPRASLLGVAAGTSYSTHSHVPSTCASYRHLHLATLIDAPVPASVSASVFASVLARSGGSNVRHYHSTKDVQDLEKNDSQSQSQPPQQSQSVSATSTPEPEKVGDDTVPVWQNPLHHQNPDMEKMFDEDFDKGETMVAAPIPPFESDPTKTVAPPHIHDLAHRIVNLTLLELKELTDRIAEHFDFDDQVMAASYSGGSAPTAAAAPQEEQQEKKVIFDLKLLGFDEKAKIKVIKEIRAIAGLGLKEAKELVEAAPKVFQKGLKQERADELKAQLEAVGAQVEIV